MTAALLAAAAVLVGFRAADVPGRPVASGSGDGGAGRGRGRCRCARRVARAGRPGPRAGRWCCGSAPAVAAAGPGRWSPSRPATGCSSAATCWPPSSPSGQPAEAALDQAAEAWPVIGPVAQCQAYGGDVPAALRRAALEPGAEGMALVAAAWHVSHRTGHGLADALGRVAQALRDGRATDRVVRGELASARATARLVAALPLVALAIGAGSGGDPLSFLSAPRSGWPAWPVAWASAWPGSPGSNGSRPRPLDDDRPPGRRSPARPSGWRTPARPSPARLGAAGTLGVHRRRTSEAGDAGSGPRWRGWARGPSSPEPPAWRSVSSLRVSCGSCSAGPRPPPSGHVG